MGYPLGLVCAKCEEVFGIILNPDDSLSKKAKPEAICSKCIGRLEKEKGITANSPENWKRLLE